MKLSKRFSLARPVYGFRPTPLVDPTLAVIGGLGLGVMLTYLLDPERGKRRRALSRDKAIHAVRKQAELLEKGTRDVKHRANGLAARIRSIGSREPTDEMLIERVRARLGHVCSHPGSIVVSATDGHVTLRGPILRNEAGRLFRAMRRLRGVRAVHNELEIHDDPGGIPGLQGDGFVPRPVLLRDHWPPALRLLAISGGLATAAYGFSRAGTTGSAIGAIGGLLAIRGMADRSFAQMVGLGPEHGITMRKTLTVDRPVEDVYAFWSRLENFPRFMQSVSGITVGPDGRMSRWAVRGPSGVIFSWDAETIAQIANERIEWRTVGLTSVAHQGTVQFEAISPHSTRITVEMVYRPPAGQLGHGIAVLLGKNPKQAMSEDLLRMKSILEHGKADDRPLH